MPVQTALTVDGDNLTTLTSSMPNEATFTEYLPTSAVYSLLEGPRVMVVEPGGGLDVLTALHHGASEVVGLVGNPLETHLLEGPLLQETAGLFADPRVTLIAGSPRGYLARDDRLYDIVVVSLGDAFRPVTSGAYSLREDYTYTTEAFRQYLRHLSSDGILMASRWVQTPPSEELRLAATVVEALEALGVGDPGANVAAIRTLQTLTLLAKMTPFTPVELRALREFTESRRIDLSYLPGLGPEDTNLIYVLPDEVYFSGLNRLMDPLDRGRYYDEQPFDVVPATDERPFFFHFFRWSQVPNVLARLGEAWEPFGGAGFLVVLAFLAVSVALSAVLIIAPLLARVSGESDGDARDRPIVWRSLVYFFALGLAFLWLELPLMQRFILLLAHPTYSFGLVLFAVLLFSGIGSILSPRLGKHRPWAVLALALLTVAYALGTGPAVDLMLALPLPARIALSVLTIAPLALLMGVPFPTGIAAIRRRRPGLVPWAWGANGYASVVGSVLATLMALSWGFTWVMLAAGIGYLVAWAALYPTFSEEAPEPG